MSEFISGKDALIALANGEELQQNISGEWIDIRRDISWRAILGEQYQFRLKPRTVNLNGVEVPAPDQIETDPNLHGGWAINIGSEYYMYKNKSDYNIVVAALRSVFCKK